MSGARSRRRRDELLDENQGGQPRDEKADGRVTRGAALQAFGSRLDD